MSEVDAGEQSASSDENDSHDHGLWNQYSCVIRLPHIDLESRERSMGKDDEESGLWFEG